MIGRSFLTKFLISLFGLFSLICTVVYIFDPLSFYRFPSFYDKQYSSEARFQIPGFVRNSDYNTVIVGTSMGRNFVESYVDERLGVKSLNATLPAGTAKEQSLTAELALHNTDVNKVIWEINYYSLEGGTDFVLNKPNEFPFHLYDNNIINDIKYLFSSYSLSLIKSNILANIKNDTTNRDREMLFKFGDGVKAAAKENLPTDFGAKINNNPVSLEHSYEYMMESFNENMLSLVDSHPDVEFIFFYAPYPITSQINRYNNSSQRFEDRLRVKEEIFLRLSNYENVKLYDFEAYKEITHDTENYMSDWTHYFMFINEYIIDYISKEEPILSLKDYQEDIQALYNQVLNFQHENLR